MSVSVACGVAAVLVSLVSALGWLLGRPPDFLLHQSGHQPALHAAEVAILVADEWQHRGLARQLLRPLAERAQSAGIERFRAEIQADNTVARRFFLGLTPTARERPRNGDVVVIINVAELLRTPD